MVGCTSSCRNERAVAFPSGTEGGGEIAGVSSERVPDNGMSKRGRSKWATGVWDPGNEAEESFETWEAFASGLDTGIGKGAKPPKGRTKGPPSGRMLEPRAASELGATSAAGASCGCTSSCRNKRAVAFPSGTEGGGEITDVSSERAPDIGISKRGIPKRAPGVWESPGNEAEESFETSAAFPSGVCSAIESGAKPPNGRTKGPTSGGSLETRGASEMGAT